MKGETGRPWPTADMRAGGLDASRRAAPGKAMDLSIHPDNWDQWPPGDLFRSVILG